MVYPDVRPLIVYLCLLPRSSPPEDVATATSNASTIPEPMIEELIAVEDDDLELVYPEVRPYAHSEHFSTESCPLRMLRKLPGRQICEPRRPPKQPRPPRCVNYSQTVYRQSPPSKISPHLQTKVHQSVMSFRLAHRLANKLCKAPMPDSRMQCHVAIVQ